MFVRPSLALGVLLIVLILIAGCSGPLLLPAPPSPTPTRAPATQPPTAAPAQAATPAGQPVQVSTSAAPPSAVIPSAVIPSATPRPVKPTATPFPVVSEEEDCMAGCHIPNPNDFIDAGAMLQPADHKGRTTCLNCHAVSQKALPESHVGRMDPSCTVCHK